MSTHHMAKVDLEQGSARWHDWRASRYTASQAPAVMGCNPWAPRTPRELYLLRTGQLEVYQNEAMRRGNEKEPRARELLEAITEQPITPACYEAIIEGLPLGASLDGITRCGLHAYEIKTPAKGSDSDLWNSKEIPDHYRWQMIHQLIVSGANTCALICYAHDLDEIRFVGAVNRHFAEYPMLERELLEAWAAFDQAVADLREPEPTDADTVDVSDEEWQAAADQYAAAKAAAAAADAKLESAKDALVTLAYARGKGAKVRGAGWQVISATRAGSVNWKAKAITQALAAAGVDPEQHRGKATTYWTIKESQA